MKGLILLNKKSGITSFDALYDIKRALGTGKVGHTGTLDKFAQGLLVVLAGRALKLSRWFSACDKKYIGKIKFGIETDTLDPEGSIIGEAEIPSQEAVEQVIKSFTGNILQAPPAYSAIHINGKRAHELARSGKMPEIKKRPVSVYRLELRSWESPYAEIFAHCSSGTYIRSLARDIALAAGSRAHLTALTRTQVAGFKLEDGKWGEASGSDSLLPIDKKAISALGLPWFDISPSEVEHIIHGKLLSPVLDGKIPVFPASSPISSLENLSAALFSGESLVAMVEKSDGMWKYGCVLPTP